MIALLLFTQRPDIMGSFANGRMTRIAAIAGTAVVMLLNTILLLQTFGVLSVLEGVERDRLPASRQRTDRRRAS